MTAKVKLEALSKSTPFVYWLSVVVISFIVIIFALTAPQIFQQELKQGSIAKHDLVATADTVVTDEEKTQRAKELARQSILPVFRLDEKINQAMLAKTDVLLNHISEIQKQLNLPFPTSFGLSPEEQVFAIECGQATWQQVAPDLIKHAKNSQAKALSTLEDARKSYQQLEAKPNDINHEELILAASVKHEQWPKTKATIIESLKRELAVVPLLPETERSNWQKTILEFLPDTWSDSLRQASAKLVATTLEPNFVVDMQASKTRAEQAAKTVKPLMKNVAAGEIVLPKGSLITENAVKTLNAMGLSQGRSWPTIVSLALSLATAYLLIGFLLFAYEPRFLFSTAAIGLMSTVCVVTFGIAAFAGQEYPQFIPLPAAALVITIFFGPRLATAMVVIMMIFLKVDGLVDIGDLIALGTASAVAIGIHIKERQDLMVRGVLIGVMQAAGYLTVVVVSQTVTSLGTFGIGLLLQLLGGLSSAIVAIGSLPFLESIFGLVTPFRLAELTDPDQPLLRGLNEHAPGTYQHSLAVANLAEAGARSIGGDVNLARAGSLYHDIGKMVRPVYFIENQLGAANPHDSIEPEESRDRVLAHVTDGVVLAEKNGLPKVVTDFIPQHQGTSIMAYFYHKACQRDGVDNVDINFYRYPGPKPQCKEAAIVMLADVSEAVTHSLKEPTQEEADKAIDLVFKARWDDGQFSESGLSPEELERVKSAFGRVWRTLHHERLKYPSTTTGRMAVPPSAPPAAS